MKLEENTMLRASRHAGTGPATINPDISSWVARNLPDENEKYIAMAPGRLDVLGGIAEYTGGLVLAVPLAEHACAGAQRRTDGLLHVVRHHTTQGNGTTACRIPLARFREANGDWMAGHSAREVLRPYSEMIACCAGTVVEAMRMGFFPSLTEGISLAIASDLEDVSGADAFAAASSAVLVCMAALTQETIEPNVAALIAQSVENDWIGNAVGPSAALCGLIGTAHDLLQFRCDSRTLGGFVSMPHGYRLMAIHCGESSQGHRERFIHVRTATFMGRLLIDRIIRHEGLLAGQWDGHLSRVSVNDFVEQLRDRLPTKMLGRDFLERFGETGDRLTRIDPDCTYKIRSRTEHHIYEHARSRQFIEAISRGIRNGDRSAFVEAGSIMNASHWSCGQRCGLGSVKANSLVNALRKTGPSAGILGARIAGQGCGGMVAVLADEFESARQTIEDSLDAYQHAHKIRARILTGSLPGAMVNGAVRV